MAEACTEIRSRGIEHILFGDLFLEDIRSYREARLETVGMRGLFPLWKRDTAVLAREMIDNGIVAYIVCLDPRRIDRAFAGRRFDAALLHELPASVDPCGENGEFHTVVTAGPMLRTPIEVAIGETVERDGFVFTDVLPR
jgi:diphthamide synthase (EF-2-diphthine--ammonia ligase)